LGREMESYTLIYALYHQATCRSSTSFRRDFAVWSISCAEDSLRVERCDVSCAKRAGVLSGDEIREIVMDSDRDEDKYYASQESEYEEEPRPPSRRLPFHSLQVQIISPASSEDDDICNVAGPQPQPTQWTLPPKHRRRVVYIFIGVPNGGL